MTYSEFTGFFLEDNSKIKPCSKRHKFAGPKLFTAAGKVKVELLKAEILQKARN